MAIGGWVALAAVGTAALWAFSAKPVTKKSSSGGTGVSKTGKTFPHIPERKIEFEVVHNDSSTFPLYPIGNLNVGDIVVVNMREKSSGVIMAAACQITFKRPDSIDIVIVDADLGVLPFDVAESQIATDKVYRAYPRDVIKVLGKEEIEASFGPNLSFGSTKRSYHDIHFGYPFGGYEKSQPSPAGNPVTDD